MIIANRTLNVIDTAFTVIEQIERIDPVAIGEKVINIIATAAAVIIGVATYVITALQLLWLQHGDSIMANAVRFIINTADYCHELYIIGTETKRYIAKRTAKLADYTYYAISGL